MNCVAIFFPSSGSLFFPILDCLAVSKCDSVPFIVGRGLLNGLLILNSYQMLRFPCHLFNASLSLFLCISISLSLSLFFFLLFISHPPIKNVNSHLLRPSRGQTRCELQFAKWETNTRNAARLPSVDAESSRACLAFQQGSPTGKLKEKKHLFRFSPFLT